MKRQALAAVLAIALALPLLLAAPARAEGGKLKVLTFNVWGIVSAEHRKIRAAAIGRRIAELDPDVVAIEEAFYGPYREIMIEHMEKAGYRAEHRRYFKNLYGSGILFISKYPIREARFHPYRVLGGIFNVEWLGGKGVAHVRVQAPEGLVDIFHTHAIARMTDVFDAEGNYIPGDPQQNDRLLHMYQIDKIVREQRLPMSRSVIITGDFNVSPEMLDYQFLVALSGMENAYDLTNPGKNESTYSVENVYVTQECSRIDHVLFKNYEGKRGFGVKPTLARVEMTDIFTEPRDMERVNYADHYGLYAEFDLAADPAPSPGGVLGLPCGCCTCLLDGYEEGLLKLSAENAASWKNLARMVYRDAYREEDRENPLLVPMARVVVAGPGDELVFEGEAREALESLLDDLEDKTKASD